jgi:DNA invertase Pin-like site-specific DNA recombinase
LLATIQPGDTILTPKLDRMSSSALDALDVLGRLKERGVSLHMLDLGGDVTGNAISKLVSRSSPPSPRPSATAPASASET